MVFTMPLPSQQMRPVPPTALRAITLPRAPDVVLPFPVVAIPTASGKPASVPVATALPPRTLDLSIEPQQPVTVEQFSPSPAEQLHRFWQAMPDVNAITNEDAPPITDDDCVVVDAAVQNQFAKIPDPTQSTHTPELACQARKAYGALRERNNLLSGH
jgi:hypothetical protein